MVIHELVVPHRDLTATHIISSIVQDNENDNEFTNEDLIISSHQRHEWDGKRMDCKKWIVSNSSRVVLND